MAPLTPIDQEEIGVRRHPGLPSVHRLLRLAQGDTAKRGGSLTSPGTHHTAESGGKTLLGLFRQERIATDTRYSEIQKMPRPTRSTTFQLNVVLLESNPLIWRRIQVSSETTLPQLHRILQVAIGWENYHLHEFITRDKTVYAEPDPDDHHFGRKVSDQTRIRVRKLLPVIGSSCQYRYDFGDNWNHIIVLECILPSSPLERYPVCLAGARSAPPEDVGGMDGYVRYLEALSDPKHKDYEELLQWRGRFDPESFTVTCVNKRLGEEFPLNSSASGKKSGPFFLRDCVPTKSHTQETNSSEALRKN